MLKKVTCPICEHIFRTNGSYEYVCPECGYKPGEDEDDPSFTRNEEIN